MLNRFQLIIFSLLSLIALTLFSSRLATSHAAPPKATITYSVFPAFYENQQVFYYIFNNGTSLANDTGLVTVSQQYRLVDSAGRPIEGQYDIIPTGGAFTAGYSDLRELINVTVPDDYQPNSIASIEDLEAQELLAEENLTYTGESVNAPLVWADSQLQGRDHDLIGLWEGGQEVAAFDFGSTPAQAAPLYRLITGFDESGAPIEFENGVITVIQQMHDDPGYSDFWQVFFVTVPEDTVPNSIRSYEQIIEVGYPIQETSTVVNCPAIRLEDMDTAYYNDVPYLITQIERPDLTFDTSQPPLYAVQGEDGITWVLSSSSEDEDYTGYCEPTDVFNAARLMTDATAIANDTTLSLEPREAMTTCAILWELLLPLE
jgi:hypothetical protein